jgi:hypothetical protein
MDAVNCIKFGQNDTLLWEIAVKLGLFLRISYICQMPLNCSVCYDWGRKREQASWCSAILWARPWSKRPLQGIPR